MPTVKKIRTVVTKLEGPHTEYIFLSVASPIKGKQERKMGIQPVKYYFKETRKMCINTTSGLMSEEKFIKYISDNYDLTIDDFEVSKMYRESHYNLYLVLLTDFDTEIEDFQESISLELFDTKQTEDTFQSVIEKHKAVGTNFKKNQWSNSNGTTLMKPLKLWKTLTGFTFN